MSDSNDVTILLTRLLGLTERLLEAKSDEKAASHQAHDQGARNMTELRQGFDELRHLISSHHLHSVDTRSVLEARIISEAKDARHAVANLVGPMIARADLADLRSAARVSSELEAAGGTAIAPRPRAAVEKPSTLRALVKEAMPKALGAALVAAGGAIVGGVWVWIVQHYRP